MLIDTVDFFPPMVDDPFVFGQIAAANSLSDIWAMGGEPALAMNLLCFPNCLDVAVAKEILAGGADKAIEAGCTIAGGHTISDDEPKYGMCVTGFARPDEVLANSSARAGDLLVLTKPIGTGVLATSFKGGILDADEDQATFEQMVDTMRTLNMYAAHAASRLAVHASTDVTGFGVVGHVCEMAEGSRLSATLHAGSVPLLPQAFEMAHMGLLPAGGYRNRDFFGKRTTVADDADGTLVDLLFDPQTSGGLLLALPERDAEELVDRMAAEGRAGAIIGELAAYDGASVHVVA